MISSKEVYGDGIGEVVLVDYMGDDARAAQAARVSFDKDELDDIFQSELTSRDEKLLNFLIRERHTSPFEHSVLTFKLTVPMFVRSQIMRHRTMSYNEVSRRYTSENIQVWMPEQLRMQSEKNLQCSSDEQLSAEAHEAAIAVMTISMTTALAAYERLLELGVAREQARAVLPGALYTSFWMTGSLHNMVHFLRLRLGAHAQPEAQVVAQAMLEQIEAVFPKTIKAMREQGVL